MWYQEDERHVEAGANYMKKSVASFVVDEVEEDCTIS